MLFRYSHSLLISWNVCVSFRPVAFNRFFTLIHKIGRFTWSHKSKACRKLKGEFALRTYEINNIFFKFDHLGPHAIAGSLLRRAWHLSGSYFFPSIHQCCPYIHLSRKVSIQPWLRQGSKVQIQFSWLNCVAAWMTIWCLLVAL